MTHHYGNSGNDVAICRVGNIPEHGTALYIKVDIWHPAVGLRCGNPHRHLNQLKTDHIVIYLPATTIVYTFPFIFSLQNTTKRKELFPLKRTTFVYVLSDSILSSNIKS
jgi:hypothetical protein